MNITDIKNDVIPIAKKYNVKAIYLFGSYARKEPTENSDIDIIVDTSDSQIKGMFSLGEFYEDLVDVLNHEIDLLTMDAIKEYEADSDFDFFVNNIKNERVLLYERAR